MIALAAFLSLGAAVASPPDSYRVLKLFELAARTHLAVAGEIVQVGDKTFDLQVQDTVLGGPEGGTLRVQRPRWRVRERWADYAEGQRLLLFLRHEAGGRVGLYSPVAEYPLAGDAAIVQPIRVYGTRPGRHAVDGGMADGAMVPFVELAAALQGLSGAFAWRLDRHGWIESIGFRSEAEALRLRAASTIGRHLYDEVVSSDQWEPAARPVTFPVHAERLDGWSGSTCTWIGDVDGNGILDLATGSRIHLMQDGGPARMVEIDAPPGSRYSEALAPLGDLDGNGAPDIAVIRSDAADEVEVSRAVCVLFLDPTGRAVRSVEIRRKEVARWLGFLTSGLDSTLAALGDLDGDGLPELAIGQGNHSVQIVSLDAREMVRWTRSIPEREVGSIVSGSCSLAGLGDVDGDGVPDLALGDLGDSDGGSRRGAVWIIGLAADGAPRWVQKISDLVGGFEGLIRDEEFLGRSLASPGDVDGDGVPELVACGQSGVWVLFLNPDGTVKRHACADVGHEPDAPLWLVGLSASCEPRPAREPGAVRLVVGSKLRVGRGDYDDALWLLRLCADGSLASQ